MGIVRAFFRQHHGLAMLLLAAVFCARLLVPEGFMPAPEQGVLSVRICHGSGLDAVARLAVARLAIPLVNKAAGASDAPAKAPAQNDPVCSFSAFGGGALAGDAPAFLAAAIAFILLLGFAPVQPAAPQSPARLRPPLRGPPRLS